MPTQEEKIVVHAPRGIPSQKLVEYLERCRANLRTLADAIDRLDYQRAQVFGHRTRGTGGAYGIPKITELGAFIEEAAVQRNESEIRRYAGSLEAYLNRIEVAPD
jgi:HPt (histidine-containing phosphotransfer) domain-containing protein